MSPVSARFVHQFYEPTHFVMHAVSSVHPYYRSHAHSRELVNIAQRSAGNKTAAVLSAF